VIKQGVLNAILGVDKGDGKRRRIRLAETNNKRANLRHRWIVQY
jgi:hypothetical protein